MLACSAKLGVHFNIARATRHACDSDPRCGLARDARSLAVSDSTTRKGVSKPMGFKIASSGDFQSWQFWCTSNFGTRLGGSLAPKKVSKTDGFQNGKFGGFSVPWSLQPRNCAAAATCSRSRCDFLRPVKRKSLRFLQRNGCELACGHRGHCDFAMRFLCL